MKKLSLLLIVALWVGCKEKKVEPSVPVADTVIYYNSGHIDSIFISSDSNRLIYEWSVSDSSITSHWRDSVSGPVYPMVSTLKYWDNDKDTIYIHDTVKVYLEFNRDDTIDLPVPQGFALIPKDSSFNWPHIIDSLYESKNKIIDTTPNL